MALCETQCTVAASVISLMLFSPAVFLLILSLFISESGLYKIRPVFSHHDSCDYFFIGDRVKFLRNFFFLLNTLWPQCNLSLC